MELKIGHLYPDLLNLYGDRGNIQCMVKRCQWRGIGASVKEFQLGDQIDFSQLDIVLLGGGSDREQRIVCEKLKTIREDFQSYVEDMGVVLAVCGGYQLLGHYYDTDQGRIEGLSLADLYTEQGSPRLISNIIIENEDFEMPFVGFENHRGRTYAGDLKPLGEVLFGCGNNGKDGQEGILYKNIVGTYLHGPLLPKNPHLCDYLLKNALMRKYGQAELSPLEDREEKEANLYIRKRFLERQ